ncbi:ATP-dependent 6-phosphofructokinase [Frankliniella fusca]|uniref:ATP-dependent 6-phosphofructokinase n=1 Tax=Frankliniella fusca TaxID=407009 RepID=A0AAE1HKZ5_9NEOP|nr:ATP-dependent 6-phosphofructokinase [Frankliniella fusca]
MRSSGPRRDLLEVLGVLAAVLAVLSALASGTATGLISQEVMRQSFLPVRDRVTRLRLTLLLLLPTSYAEQGKVDAEG